LTKLQEIDYRPDSARVFAAFLDAGRAVFLDSAGGTEFAGRYDILAANPYLTLTTRGPVTEIREHGELRISAKDPLWLLQQALAEGPPAAPSSLPFTGGAIGYFAYDLGRRFERFEGSARRDIDLPEMAVGLYDWALIVDHRDKRSWLASAGRDPATFAQWDSLLELARGATARPRAPFEVMSALRTSVDRAAYAEAFGRVKAHIRAGDCYQVNLTQRFAAEVGGHAYDAYLQLRRANPAPFSAYLEVPGGEILCSSPERFLRVEDGRVETRPIKGTRPRSADPAVDRNLALELAASAKDRAENVMIVDLLRNDLGRNCMAGSIEAGPLFEIESYASVHHLVSTVTGQLRPDRHPLDLLRGCFPGGSITGAPKLRAMQIIDELEPQRRSVYCGSLGYIGFDGRMDLNIAIRTLVRAGSSIYAWAGGGIVADSELESEFQESLDKAAAMLGVLTPPRSAQNA
jgi:para-aminobenzoate synthetase component 1